VSTREELQIDPARLSEWLESEPGLQVIDVREPHEREAGYLAGSRHIELTQLTGEAASIESDRPVVFYCRVGSRSQMAAEAFRTAGYEAYSLQGGLLRWADEGRALSPPDGRVAEH
jgi:rhodanese-related sulfurtransferase